MRYGGDADVAEGYGLAGLLAEDPDPAVNRAVRIFLKHAGAADAGRLTEFLDGHAASMARPALRLAIEKLDPAVRARYLASGPDGPEG